MAKPRRRNPASAMQSPERGDTKTRKNISAMPMDAIEPVLAHIAGLQKYMPAAMGLFCANVIPIAADPYLSAPINVHWGTTTARPAACSDVERRCAPVENRVGGADANPYIAIAASLA